MKGIFKAARTLIFGGCLHRKMGWPIWLGGHAYRVCLDCGITQLFDEERLRGYGPYSYQDLDALGHEGSKGPGHRIA